MMMFYMYVIVRKTRRLKRLALLFAVKDGYET